MDIQSFTVSNDGNEYHLDKYIGQDKSGVFRLYRCVSGKEPERWLIFKIATDREHNGMLDREAWLLSELRDFSLYTEDSYQKEVGGDALNYHYAFPQVEASFLLESQGGRRANVLRFDVADDIGELAPLSLVRSRDRVRVDLKTSSWIAGKLLKTLVFTHSFGVANGNMFSSNLLIQRDHHLVSVFDWTQANQYGRGSMPREVRVAEIQAVAKVVLELLSNRDGNIVPDSDQDHSGYYVEGLKALMAGKESDAYRAHTLFYDLVEELWGRKYHPWTTIPL
jgi:hypothetical protein